MKKAFTLIEFIFVLVIVGILAAAVVPKIESAINEAENFKTEKAKAIQKHTGKPSTTTKENW